VPTGSAFQTNIIVRNELPNDKLSYVEVYLYSPSGQEISQRIKLNNTLISDSNPLAPGVQADSFAANDPQGFRKVSLRYKVEGSSLFVYAALITVGKNYADKFQHYLQQAIILPRTTNGKQTVWQIDEMQV